MINKTKYYYILVFSITTFTVSFVGSTIENTLHNIGIIESLNHFHHYVIPIFLGIFTGIFGFFYWKRKNQQQIAINKLKESEYNHRVLFENMEDVVSILDNDGNIININEAGIKLFEYDREEILKMKVSDIVYKEDVEISKEHFKKLENDGFYSLYEGRIKTKSGKIIWVQVNSKEFIKNGVKVGSQDIVRDVTKLKLVEQQMIQQNLELKDLNNTKDKLFSIIAHDLKSPFNSIIGFSELLSNNFENFNDTQKKKYLKIIHKGISNTYKLLENLLLWTQTQRGKLVFNPEKINLYLLTNDSIKLMSLVASNKSITIKNLIPESLSLKADETMLSTILRNLISNAIKFTPNGGTIEIDSRLTPKNDTQNYIEISVKDSGVGIPKELKSQIFNIANNTIRPGTDNEKGTGLGLILCKEFVEKHGGKIWVEENTDKGSVFTFSLPTVI